MNQKTSRPQNLGAASDARYNYRNLRLWQEAQEIAADVIRVAASVRRNTITETIIRQLVGAAASVSANIAEGHGRFSLAAYKNHLSIAKASACETDNFLDLLRRTGYISAVQEEELHTRIFALIGLLVYRMRQLETMLAERKGKVGEEPGQYSPDDGDDVSWFED